MKKNIILSIFIIFCISCSTSKVVDHRDLVGSFYGTFNAAPDAWKVEVLGRYFLELGVDSIFYFKITQHGYEPECIGTWTLRRNTICLKCSDVESLPFSLSSAFMPQRDYIIKALNNNKLKYNKQILKRTDKVFDNFLLKENNTEDFGN